MEKQKADWLKCGAVVFNPEGKFLIVRKKGDSIWISLGGRIEPGESHEECLKRELLEELNLELTRMGDLVVETDPEPAATYPDKTIVISYYLVETTGEPLINPEDTVEEYMWFGKEEFESGKYEIAEIIRKYLIPALTEKGMF